MVLRLRSVIVFVLRRVKERRKIGMGVFARSEIVPFSVIFFYI